MARIMDADEWKRDVEERKTLNEQFKGKVLDVEAFKKEFRPQWGYPIFEVKDGVISVETVDHEYHYYYKVRIDSKNRIVRILKAEATVIVNVTFTKTETEPCAPDYDLLGDALFWATGGIPEE